MEDSALKFIGAGLTMLGTGIGAGLGLSRVFSSWLDGIARNPSSDAKLRTVGFIAFAGTELVLLLGFVIAFLSLR